MRSGLKNQLAAMITFAVVIGLFGSKFFTPNPNQEALKNKATLQTPRLSDFTQSDPIIPSASTVGRIDATPAYNKYAESLFASQEGRHASERETIAYEGAASPLSDDDPGLGDPAADPGFLPVEQAALDNPILQS